MSYCRQEGKDTIIFVTKEDHVKPSTTVFGDNYEDEPGLITNEGEINWSCPCLGGMATGPCGVDFREAFSCFHYSDADPKGTDCYDQFRRMQDCMVQYPSLYDQDDDAGTEKGLSQDIKDDDGAGIPSESTPSSDLPTVKEDAGSTKQS